jgi:ribosomal protein S8
MIIPKDIKIAIMESKKIDEIIDFFKKKGYVYNRKYIRENFIIAYSKFLEMKYFSDKDSKNDNKKI